MEDSLFAYSMCQSEQGWTWRLWDETGDVVAAGEAPDQASAHHRLLEAFETARNATTATPAAIARPAPGPRPRSHTRRSGLARSQHKEVFPHAPSALDCRKNPGGGP